MSSPEDVVRKTFTAKATLFFLYVQCVQYIRCMNVQATERKQLKCMDCICILEATYKAHRKGSDATKLSDTLSTQSAAFNHFHVVVRFLTQHNTTSIIIKHHPSNHHHQASSSIVIQDIVSTISIGV